MERSRSAVAVDERIETRTSQKPYARSRDEEEKLLDRFRDPNDPLKLLIVTAKLLTGFNAPILQAMYLDKPLRDHTLLQAICRTNRTYGDKKTHGVAGAAVSTAQADPFSREVEALLKGWHFP